MSFVVFSPPSPFSSGLRHLPLEALTLSLRLVSLYTGDKLAYFSDTAKVLAVITNYEQPVSLTKMKRSVGGIFHYTIKALPW